MNCRVVTGDALGQPVNFYWPYRMDFKASLSLSVDEESDYTLDGKSITFIVKDKLSDSGVYLLEQGITDGNIKVDGLTITVDIPYADLDDAGIVEGDEYEYGLTIGEPIDGNRIQGLFFALDETGFVEPGCNTFSLSLSDFTASLTTAGIGQRGLQGPPGNGHAGLYRLIDATGPILASDSTVEIIAGGADIAITLPDPADNVLFTNDNFTTTIFIFRQLSDTGAVVVIGDGVELINGSLFPGQSFSIRSNGTKFLYEG